MSAVIARRGVVRSVLLNDNEYGTDARPSADAIPVACCMEVSSLLIAHMYHKRQINLKPSDLVTSP